MKTNNQIPTPVDHQITLFYFFKHQVNINCFDDYEVKKTGLPKEHIDAIYKRLKQLRQDKPKTKFWQACSYNTSSDFKHTIDQLFHAKQKRPIQSFELDTKVIRLLSGNYIKNLCDKASPLKLLFNQSAIKRLKVQGEDVQEAQIQFEQIYCHQFLSGFSIVEVRLSISKLSSACLLNEALYALIRNNRICWGNNRLPKLTDNPSLGKFIRNLLSKTNNKQIERVYSHTYIQLNQSPKQQDLDNYLLKLAHHYNQEYHLNLSENSATIDHEFSNKTHCLAHEGAATCICIDEDSPEFLKHYKQNVIIQSHLPLHLLAFHAEKVLHHFSTHNTFWVDKNILETPLDTQHLARLQAQQLQLLNFEINFFHPVISNISSHNRLYKQLLETKQLKEEQQKIRDNNQAIKTLADNALAKQHQRANHRANTHYCQIAQIGAAAAGFLTTKTIAKELLEFVLTYPDQENSVVHWFHHNHGIELISTILALTGAVSVYLFARKRCQQANQSHHNHSPSQQAHHAVHATEFLENTKKK